MMSDSCARSGFLTAWRGVVVRSDHNTCGAHLLRDRFQRDDRRDLTDRVTDTVNRIEMAVTDGYYMCEKLTQSHPMS